MDQSRFNLGHVGRALAAPASEATSDYDLNPEVRPARGPMLRPAAVLVPLVERGPGLSVLLTRRAAGLRTHAGQIAFPGGRLDPDDADLRAAALREAEEEIGLPRKSVTVLGAIEPHETVTRFAVTAFVGHVHGAFRPVPDPREVEEVFEVPLAFVMEPANFQVHRRRWRGAWRSYYAIPYGSHYIWGATARMLKALADRLDVA